MYDLVRTNYLGKTFLWKCYPWLYPWLSLAIICTVQVSRIPFPSVQSFFPPSLKSHELIFMIVLKALLIALLLTYYFVADATSCFRAGSHMHTYHWIPQRLLP